MDLLAFAAALTVMGAIIATAMALYYSTATPRSSIQRRLGSLLSQQGGFEVTAADYHALREKRTGHMPLISGILEGKNWTAEMAARLERSDMKLTVSEFVSIRIFFGLIAAAILLFLVENQALRILLLIVGTFIGFKIPSIYLNMAISKRVKKLDSQLPDTLTMLANSLKAGFGIMQSLDLASRELAHPISTELRRVLHDINVGSTTEEALQNLTTRNGSSDLDIVVTAMMVQQTTGGNLSEILDTVAHTMRERIRIRGEIKTLTIQQMATGFVIGGMPVVMAVLLYLMNPDYMTPLFTETFGRIMLVGGAILETAGILMIKKILAIEV